jgi:hypothetical protein
MKVEHVPLGINVYFEHSDTSITYRTDGYDLLIGKDSDSIKINLYDLLDALEVFSRHYPATFPSLGD